MAANSQNSGVSDSGSNGVVQLPDTDYFPPLGPSQGLLWDMPGTAQSSDLDTLRSEFGVLSQDLEQTRETCREYGAKFAIIEQELESIRNRFYRLERRETERKPQLKALRDSLSVSSPGALPSPTPTTPLPQNTQASITAPVTAVPITTKHGIRFSAQVSRTTAPTECLTSAAGPSASTTAHSSHSMAMIMSVGMDFEQIQRDSKKKATFFSRQADDPRMRQKIQTYINSLNRPALRDLVMDLFGLVLDIRIVVPGDQEGVEPSVSMAFVESEKPTTGVSPRNLPETPHSAKSTASSPFLQIPSAGIMTPSSTASPHTPAVHYSQLFTPASGSQSSYPMPHNAPATLIPSAPTQALSGASQHYASPTPARAMSPYVDMANAAASQRGALNAQLFAGPRPQVQLQPPSHSPIAMGPALPTSIAPAQLAGQKRKAVAADITPSALIAAAAVPSLDPSSASLPPQGGLQWSALQYINPSNLAPPQQMTNYHGDVQYLSTPATNAGSPYDGRPIKRQRYNEDINRPPGTSTS